MAAHYEVTFLDWLRQQPPGACAPQEVAHFIQQAAGALQRVHDQQMVHGHITPASFLILPGGEQSGLPNLRLADFSTQEPASTPASMAPEQWYGTVLPASDQYALAVMAYRLLTWRPPFQGNQIPGPPRETVAAPSRTGSPTNKRTLVSSMSREVLALTLVFIIVVSGIGFGFYAIVKHNRVVAASLTSSPTPVPTREAALVATVTSGQPLFADSLSSDDGHWDRSATCVFTGGTYHVLVQQAGRLGLCGLRGSTYGNAAIQVDVSLLAGNYTGLVFRFTDSGSKLQDGVFYYVRITKQGEFFLGRYSGGNVAPLIPITKTSAITAANQKNTLLVIAKGSDFKVYINGIFVGEAQDSTSSSGQIGFMIATSDTDPRGDASFANFKLYTV